MYSFREAGRPCLDKVMRSATTNGAKLRLVMTAASRANFFREE